MPCVAGQWDDEGAPQRPRKSEERRARLEQALRDNLLKRKAQSRAKKTSPPPKEKATGARGEE
jgi:hypothetical protein